MKVNIDCCFFVLENITNENKKRNDDKKLELLVNNNNNVINVTFDGISDIKTQIKEKIKKIINNDNFHLEQVYTLGEKRFNKDGINIIYLGITNKENISSLDNDYKLVDIEIKKDEYVSLDKEIIKYRTKQIIENNSIEYIHEVETKDIDLEKQIIEIITSYKQIIAKIDNTDIMFKFLPKYFSLEDVRIIYEKIKDVKVDKSNFRKRIVRYCSPTDKIVNNKGYRPTTLYEFVLDENDKWI